MAVSILLLSMSCASSCSFKVHSVVFSCWARVVLSCFFFRNVSCFFRDMFGGEGDATKRRFSLVFCRCSVFPLVFLGFFPPGGVKIPQVLVGNSRSTSGIFTSTCRVPPRIWLILSFGWFLFFSLFFLFLLRLFFRQGGGS